MKIIDAPITISEAGEMAKAIFVNMLKAVVDIDKGIVAIDAELHSDLESLLLENGSRQNNLWGINIYPELEGNDTIEFDSMINVRPSCQNNSRFVEDPAIREKIITIIKRLITS
jgi:hypothetical protein